MEFLTEETTRKLKKWKEERYKNFEIKGVSTGRFTQKLKIKVGDIIVKRFSIGKIKEVDKHSFSLVWENDILSVQRERKYHRSLLIQKLRIGEWKIYKEISIEELNI